MSAIVAIATPPGSGGIGIVRISGPGAKKLLARVFLPYSAKYENFIPWHLHHGVVLDDRNEALDDALAVFMPGPKTFTGEDVAEIHCHGSPLVLEILLGNLLRLGARQAQRGEFTRRAFMNGRLDLSQAEAVAELIASPSREALRYSLNRLDGLLGKKINAIRDKLDELRSFAYVAVDFPDDEVPAIEEAEFTARTEKIISEIEDLLKNAARARSMEHGVMAVIAGAVNAGKSSLLNDLAGRERALVTDIPGTTRDFIEVHLDLDGLPVRMIDTAGLRPEAADQEGLDKAESLGIDRSIKLLEEADIVILLLDSERMGNAAADSSEVAAYRDAAARARGQVIYVWNKIDLCQPPASAPEWFEHAPSCAVCARDGSNLDRLCALIRELVLKDSACFGEDAGIAPNMRQAECMRTARNELQAMLQDNSTFDCRLARLDTAAAALDEILGLSSHEELLDKIFSTFCIGK